VTHAATVNRHAGAADKYSIIACQEQRDLRDIDRLA